MVTWIATARGDGQSPPDPVLSVVEGLGDLGDLSGVQDVKGGIRRDDVVRVLSSRWASIGVRPLSGSRMDGLHPSGVAVRVEAGRAHTNNDGVIAALEAALDPRVTALVLVVPAAYKGSVTAEKVEERLRRYLSAPGIKLDVQGVAVLAY
jgi:hypothetical protein